MSTKEANPTDIKKKLRIHTKWLQRETKQQQRQKMTTNRQRVFSQTQKHYKLKQSLGVLLLCWRRSRSFTDYLIISFCITHINYSGWHPCAAAMCTVYTLFCLLDISNVMQHSQVLDTETEVSETNTEIQLQQQFLLLHVHVFKHWFLWQFKMIVYWSSRHRHRLMQSLL